MDRYNHTEHFERKDNSSDGKNYFGKILRPLAIGGLALTLLGGCSLREVQRDINRYDVKQRIHKQYCCENPDDPSCVDIEEEGTGGGDGGGDGGGCGGAGGGGGGSGGAGGAGGA